MSRTDELRRLLDERSVKHSDHFCHTAWRDEKGWLHVATEQIDKSLTVDSLTPEQAIAATLGDSEPESYGQVPEQGKHENGGERESCGEVCGDDRFELIGKAKRKLLECTNIEMRPDEMAVIDSILFRCWQMGWLDQLRDADTRWFELFGTPERAARTLAGITCDDGVCEGCTLYGAKCSYDSDAMLEWLMGEGVVIDEPDPIRNELTDSGLLRGDA